MRLVKCATNRMEPVCRAISVAFHSMRNALGNMDMFSDLK